MNLTDWEASVPSVITKDPIWKMEAYRLGLFLSDLAWIDGSKMLKDVRSLPMADQLCRATARISACITEGYSRGTSKARAAFYEYALGSARESRDWYYKGRHVLTKKVASHRMELCTQLIRLLTKMAANEHRHERRIAPRAHAKSLITPHSS